MIRLFIGLCTLSLFFSCNTSASSSAELPPSNEITLDSFLLGSWENERILIVVNTANGTDSSYTISIEQGEWEQKLKQRPILTEYKADRTYRSEYRDLNDSLFRVTRGIWNTFGDTLLLITPEATYEYQVGREKDAAIFSSLLDWDGDQIEDDEYESLQRKVAAQ
jgi:hypothetical protein